MTQAISLVGTREEVVRVVTEAADLLASHERRDWFVAVGRMAGERRAERQRGLDRARGSRLWLWCWGGVLILGSAAAFAGAAAILPGKHTTWLSSHKSIETNLQMAVPALWVAVPLLLVCVLAPIPRNVGRDGAVQATAGMCAVLVVGVLTLALATWSSYAAHVEPARLVLWASLLTGVQLLAAVACWRLWRRSRAEQALRSAWRPPAAHLAAARLADEAEAHGFETEWPRRVRGLGLSLEATDQALALGPAGYLAWAYYAPLSEQLPRPVSFLRAVES